MLPSKGHYLAKSQHVRLKFACGSQTTPFALELSDENQTIMWDIGAFRPYITPTDHLFDKATQGNVPVTVLYEQVSTIDNFCPPKYRAKQKASKAKLSSKGVAQIPRYIIWEHDNMVHYYVNVRWKLSYPHSKYARR